MKNPFPGMDPWMEGQWGDAHARMIVYASDQIAERLPADLRARVEERVYVAADVRWAGRMPRQPDARVEEFRPRDGADDATRAAVAPGTGVVAVATPVVVPLPADLATEGYIEIRERRPSNRLVTVIEVLSPANKRRGRGRSEYRAKQRECLEAGVNLVEIDLLRGGRWTVVAPRENAPEETAAAAFRVSVWRGTRPKAAELYGLPLRDRLPAVAVPLREQDPDVPLDLQPLVDRVYVAGHYDDTDYARRPTPKLSLDDMAWAAALLGERGLLEG